MVKEVRNASFTSTGYLISVNLHESSNIYIKPYINQIHAITIAALSKWSQIKLRPGFGQMQTEMELTII